MAKSSRPKWLLILLLVLAMWFVLFVVWVVLGMWTGTEEETGSFLHHAIARP